MVTEAKDYPLSSEKKEEATSRQHKAIQKVTGDIERFSYNTAISALMEWVNFMYLHGTTPEACRVLTLMISPFAPYMAEELWALLTQKGSVHSQSWPEFDPELCIDDQVKLVVQVNGKVRAQFDANRDLSKEQAQEIALQQDRLLPHLENVEIIKVIHIPNKLLNLVVKPKG